SKALGVCTIAACDADGARLREPSPLHLEAVRGRILLDEERGPPEDRGELLQDPRRDLEALPRVVDAHEVLRHPMADLEIAHQRFQIGSLEDPLHEGPVLRHDVPGPRDILRAPLDPRPELPTVLVAARAVMDRRLPASLEDPQRDGVRPPQLPVPPPPAPPSHRPRHHPAGPRAAQPPPPAARQRPEDPPLAGARKYRVVAPAPSVSRPPPAAWAPPG